MAPDYLNFIMDTNIFKKPIDISEEKNDVFSLGICGVQMLLCIEQNELFNLGYNDPIQGE